MESSETDHEIKDKAELCDECERESMTKTLKGSVCGHLLHDEPIEPRCETPPDYIESE